MSGTGSTGRFRMTTEGGRLDDSVHRCGTRSGAGEVKRESLGTLQAAQQVAKEWRDKGYMARITDEKNTSCSG